MRSGLILFMASAAILLLEAGHGVAQTCLPKVRSTAPASRYIDHGDGTVTDTTTGLMWKQCAEGLEGAGCTSGQVVRLAWKEALSRPQENVFAGHNDWRLPTYKELSSLVEERCYDPAINVALFPSSPPAGFWSSTADANRMGYAWVVGFGYGDAFYGSESGPYFVRLVRDSK